MGEFANRQDKQRLHGIERMDQIKFAILESTGDITIVPRVQAGPRAARAHRRMRRIQPFFGFTGWPAMRRRISATPFGISSLELVYSAARLAAIIWSAVRPVSSAM